MSDINDQEIVTTEPKITEVAITHQPLTMAASVMPDLDALEPGMSLSASYYEFETPGEIVRAVFIGFTQMNNQQGNRIPTACFQGKDRVWVNAGTNLVDQVQRITPGTPVQVQYKGKEKTKNGNNVKVFDVRLLVQAGSHTAAPAPVAASVNGHADQPAPAALPDPIAAFVAAPKPSTWLAALQALGATETDALNAFDGMDLRSWLKAQAGRTPALAVNVLRAHLDTLAPIGKEDEEPF